MWSEKEEKKFGTKPEKKELFFASLQAKLHETKNVVVIYADYGPTNIQDIWTGKLNAFISANINLKEQDLKSQIFSTKDELPQMMSYLHDKCVKPLQYEDHVFIVGFDMSRESFPGALQEDSFNKHVVLAIDGQEIDAAYQSNRAIAEDKIYHRPNQKNMNPNH